MRDRDDEYDLDELDDDVPALMPCPHCFGTIHEESEQCPHCGQYLSEEDRPRRSPLWIWLGVVACLIVVARWILTRP